MDTSPPRLCVVGSLNVDTTVRTPRLPNAGETVLGEPAETTPGGKGANQAVAAARAGAQVRMIGRVGDDDDGRALRASLRSAGVDDAHVRPTGGVATGRAMITLEYSTDGKSRGSNTIVVSLGANSSLTPSDIDDAHDLIAAADVILLQLEIPAATAARAAALARELGATVVLNAAPADRATPGLLAAADVLIMNEPEASALTGDASFRVPDGAEPDEHAQRMVRRLGVRTVVVTLGARGAWCLHERSARRVEPYAVTPVDPVGAGDAFCGFFAARWGEHQVGGGAGGTLDDEAVHDALCWACAAGALATTKRGAINAMPTRDAVKNLLRTGSLMH